KKICENANAVIVPSEYLSGVVKGWGVYGEKIRVVYNGTDFKPLDIAREEARKKIGIAGNVIVSIGRLVPWKGFKMLIKIMPKLFEVGQFFRLVIIGDGPEKKVLESMVKNMGLDRKVFVVGAKTKDELALYLAASDVFVLNTGYEGFSHQILEVMAAGVPVITTAVGGNKEIINQGENGFMVRYNDEFNLIEAIKTLHNMPELKEKFIEEGKKTVAEFSLERMYGETVTLIEEVLLPNKFTNLK
ncbi:MAG: Glycosyltransferase, partial [Candidatus Yanofskybacteria bacterium GW2011_GWF1_44_227]